MRFVPAYCITEGMICGKNLYGKSGELLLSKGAIIHQSYIEKIQQLGYNGIYIDDDLSKDIEVMEVISSSLRVKSIKTLKEVFRKTEQGKALSKEHVNHVSILLGDIINNIMANKDLMINMLDLKVFDDYTFYHSVNVTVLSLIIGINLGFNKEQLYKLGLAAMLHDIGKVFVPKELLNKPGKLTGDEFDILKTHSFKGYDYLKDKQSIPPHSYLGILHHHEKYDGMGYPMGFKGDKISLFGRIISIADVYDALTSDRPYRKAMIPSEAIEYVMGGGGSMFDPNIAVLFVQKIAPYPVGTCVLLSNNMIGLVVENYCDCCIRPKVKIIKHGDTVVEPYYLDLRNDVNTRDITIVGISDG